MSNILPNPDRCQQCPGAKAYLKERSALEHMYDASNDIRINLKPDPKYASNPRLAALDALYRGLDDMLAPGDQVEQSIEDLDATRAITTSFCVGALCRKFTSHPSGAIEVIAVDPPQCRSELQFSTNQQPFKP